MKTWWRESPLTHQPVARCSECHKLIVEVPDVGWLDPCFGDAYDMCEVNPYGNHTPEAAGQTAGQTAGRRR